MPGSARGEKNKVGGPLPKSDPEILPGTMSGRIPGELPAENPREKTEDADRHGKAEKENGLCVQGESIPCAQAFFFWQSFSLRKEIITRRSCSQAALSGTHQPSGGRPPGSEAGNIHGAHERSTTGAARQERWRVLESKWRVGVEPERGGFGFILCRN